MKKIEIILIIASLLGIVLDFLLIPGSSLLLFCSLGSLIMIYFYLGFALFNGVRLRNLLKKESFNGIPKQRIILALLAGIALSTTVTGVIFELFYWLGGPILLKCGLLGLVIVLVGLFVFKVADRKFNLPIIKRIGLFGILGASLLVVPKSTLIDFKYRKYPNYAKALKMSLKYPENKEMREKVRRERDIMNQDN